MTVIFTHVANTLPDGLKQRLAVLEAMDSSLSETHPVKGVVQKQIKQLKQLQVLEKISQLEFERLLKGAAH